MPATEPHADIASSRGGPLAGGLLSERQLNAGAIRQLLAEAQARLTAQTGGGPRPLTGKTVALLFTENSTRTRGSFAAAASELGATVIDLSSGSSASKGESLADTARTLAAQGVWCVVARTKGTGGPGVLAAAGSSGQFVINAGEGTRAHPTQALGDALAFARAMGRGDFDLSGLTIGIAGDIGASRVARSDIGVFTALGAEVVCIGPAAAVPAGIATLGRSPGRVRIERDIDAVIDRLDGIQMLRVQTERHGGGDGKSVGPFASARACVRACGLTAERAARMKPGAVVMHPGPMNRGVEIADAVAGDWRAALGSDRERMPRVLVADQVACCLAVRRAVFAMLAEATLGSEHATTAAVRTSAVNARSGAGRMAGAIG